MIYSRFSFCGARRLASAIFYTPVVGLGNFLSVELYMPSNIMVRGCMECIDALQGVRHRARRLIINMSRRESCKHHSSQIFTSVCDRCCVCVCACVCMLA